MVYTQCLNSFRVALSAADQPERLRGIPDCLCSVVVWQTLQGLPSTGHPCSYGGGDVGLHFAHNGTTAYVSFVLMTHLLQGFVKFPRFWCAAFLFSTTAIFQVSQVAAAAATTALPQSFSPIFQMKGPAPNTIECRWEAGPERGR